MKIKEITHKRLVVIEAKEKQRNEDQSNLTSEIINFLSLVCVCVSPLLCFF